MTVQDAMKQTAVLGAAGKMGCGIALLLMQEMARQEAEETGNVGAGNYALTLVDSNKAGLRDLKRYLRTHVRQYAERNINRLRAYFAHQSLLISNQEVIEAFVEGALDNAALTTDPGQAKDSNLIFEAIVENLDTKAEILASIDRMASGRPYYFTNTSSIPIGILSQQSGISGRLIGCHFYNPPPIQKLLEIIPAETTEPRLLDYTREIANRLDKSAVVSKDVAGFIGNGHFIREIDFACRKVKELEKEYTHTEAVWILNRVTQDYLIRPMGIFQLMDYVGLDVAHRILDIMTLYLKIPFEKGWAESLLKQGIIGGQKPDGSQRDGIFHYERSRIVKIWDGRQYVDLPHDRLGPLPEGHAPWKVLQKDRRKREILEQYFKNLFQSRQQGALLAQEYLVHSREIARKLVAEGVAATPSDVNTVLVNGFYHLYGPIQEWIPEEVNHPT